MSDPRYRYAHQQERKRLAPLVESGAALCMQTDPLDPRSPPGSGCIMASRWIHPLAEWHVLHDATGTITLGPGHARCNLRDAAVRGNKSRAKRRSAWRL